MFHQYLLPDELHRQNPQKGGKRPRYGGTTQNGLVKNTLVKHIKHGLTRISGFGKRGISVYDLAGTRLCQNAKTSDFKVLRSLEDLGFHHHMMANARL